MDLPKKRLGWTWTGFNSRVPGDPGKEKVVRELKKAAESAQEVYLAPTPTARARPSPGTSPTIWGGPRTATIGCCSTS